MIERTRWTSDASPRVEARWWAEWDCLNDTHLQSHPLLSSHWARTHSIGLSGNQRSLDWQGQLDA
jgi:hypothetical protein